MRIPIEDEFKDLNVSRQRKYQLRQHKLGKCTLCQNEAASGRKLCMDHLLLQRAYHKRRRENQ